MATASGNPADMAKYRSDGIAMVEALEAEVPELETALSELRTALSSASLPEEFDVTVLFHEKWFDTLVGKQRHLDEWVGDVGVQFTLAGGGDPDNPVDTEITVDDSGFVLGHAAQSESQDQGEQDAQDLAEILDDAGIMHPYDIENNPEKLEELVETYPELAEILARSEQYADDESYAAAFINELGADDVRTLVDLTNTYGIAHDRGLLTGDAYEGFVEPFAALLGDADKSGDLDPDIYDTIFDMDPTDEPPFDDVSTEFAEQDLSLMRHRSLAILLEAGDFSAQTTAELADQVTGLHAPIPNPLYDYEGWTNAQFLADHQSLASNEWAAFEALANNDEASFIFYGMDNDEFEGELENFAHMNGSSGVYDNVAARRLGLSPDDVGGQVDALIAQSLQGGLLEYPLATGTTYDPETTTLVSAMIEAGGWDHMDAPDAVRETMAQVTTPYSVDVAIEAEGNDPNLPESRLVDLSEDDIDAFMQEVSESEGARMVLSQNAAALVRQSIDGDIDDILDGNPYAAETGDRLATAYYRELGESWNAVQVDWKEQREALVAGWQTVTDPVVDLVSGKIVEKIPVVSTAADLPLVSDVVDGITDGIKDSINTAVYDTLIPEPELEAMTTWRDAIETEVYTQVAGALYDNEDSRQYFLDDLKADDPERYDEITSDGTVTFEEFQSIDEVQDTVNGHGGDILTELQAQMAFNETFAEPG